MSYRLLNLIRQFSDQKILADIRRFHMKTSSTYVRGNELNPPATLRPIDVNKKYLKLIEFSDISYNLESDHSIILNSRNRIKKERSPSAYCIAEKNSTLKR